MFSHLCSLRGGRRARNERVCSGHSALPPRWLYSGTDQQSGQRARLSFRRIFPRSESPLGRSRRLQTQHQHGEKQRLGPSHLGSPLGGLTLADVGVSHVPLRMLEVEGPALFAVVSRRVVKAAVANASAGVPRGHVHGHVKVARVRVLVAVAPCRRHREPSQRSGPAHRGDLFGCGVDSRVQALLLRPSAGLQGRSWWKSSHCSQFSPLVLWLHMQCP